MLVAGAGPVGLTVACELARRGVPVRVIDQADGPSVTSRATAVHARTLEIFDQMGLIDDLLPRGQRVVHFSLHRRGRRLICFDTNYAALPTRFPHSLMVGQVVTEEVLRTGLRRLGVEVEWGVALADVRPGEAEVSVRLARSGGTSAWQPVPWLVGADGAHSLVRKRLGLRLLGDSSETWMNADVVLDADLPRDSNHLLHTGNGTILLVPFPEERTWRAVDTVDVHDADDREAVRRRLEGKISQALGRPVTAETPSWVSVFTAQQRMIQQMRVGRCFVAGDAAHVHSPASGQGMNTGIQDAYNLGWKLAQVVRGEASERLLDSYPAERVPVGARLLRSTRTATALVALRTALAPVLLPLGLGVLSMLRPVKRRIEGKMIRGFSGLALDYSGGPLTLGRGTGRIRPGERVGWTSGMERRDPAWRALAEELRDPRWTLLAFADGEPWDLADDAATSVRAVVPASGPDEDPARGPRPLADPGGVLGDAFGASPGQAVVIRPDGYLAGVVGREDVAAALAGLGLVRAAAPDAMEKRRIDR
ncbi:oxygenase [Actinomadura harenae]|uniref:Oxygenase n=1 Tax=Actinomadura harenae TaxID=2483351 RepID=A0A3M2M280_9ACTN|nr:oxygenase [Actinomadura harenae]